ncbi:MAG TPA: hypothetical protein DCE42_17520 [Myxococcales bacterium]|nr:hypothetical protein [Myxococcales bacterium]
MFKVLIADKLPEEKVDEMEALGLDVVNAPQLTAGELPANINEANILCVRSTKVTKETINAAKDLILIIRVGSGVNTIDLDAASQKGIYVANCPGKNAIAVAELAMGLMLSIDRQIPQCTADLRANLWNKKKYAKADGIKGKTIGIAGFGRIGRAVAQRALAFEMNVMAWDVFLTPEGAKQAGVQYCDTLHDLCSQADVITAHLPLTDETNGLFGPQQFAAMKPNAIFINTSRGEIHDEEALLQAMNERGLRAGLDVFHNEPSSGDHTFDAPILTHPNLVGTHHIGASTNQAQLSVASEAIRIIRGFLEHGQIANCVNLKTQVKSTCQLIVRDFDKVGVLAAVMEQLREADINIAEMSNTVFHGAQTAVATIQLNKVPPDSLIEQLESMNDMVIQAMVTQSKS